MRRFGFTLLAASALLAGEAQAQTNFSSYVSIGDSLAAGFWSGGLAENHQQASVPAILARQAGVADFQLPLVSDPGIPPVLTLVNLTPTIVPKAATPGAPRNLGLARPYNNLAVPGATSVDALMKVSDGGGLHDLILRGLGTQVQQAVAQRPTFVTVWIVAFAGSTRTVTKVCPLRKRMSETLPIGTPWKLTFEPTTMPFTESLNSIS